MSTVAQDMQFHELANVFPFMPGSEIDELADDIRKNGLLNPITTYEGKILDGRHRYKACLIARVDPKFIELDDGVSPEDFVIAQNLHRRHLTESQRAMVAGKLANLKKGDNQHTIEDRQICGPSSKQAAEKLNVGVRSVTSAKKVLAEGHETIKSAVESGKLAVATAEKFVRAIPDKDKQRHILATQGPSGVVDIVSAQRKEDRLKKERATETKPEKSLQAVSEKTQAVGSSMQFAQFAILQLERIQVWDTHKFEAVELVEVWIANKKKEWNRVD